MQENTSSVKNNTAKYLVNKKVTNTMQNKE